MKLLDDIIPKINIDFYKTRRVFYIYSNKDKGIRYLSRQVEYDMQGNITELIFFNKEGSIDQKLNYEYCSQGVVSVINKTKGSYSFEEYFYNTNNFVERKIRVQKQTYENEGLGSDDQYLEDWEREELETEISEYYYDDYGRIVKEITTLDSSITDSCLSRKEYDYLDNANNMISYHYLDVDSQPFVEMTLFSPDRKIKINNVYNSDGGLHTTELTKQEANGNIICSQETIQVATPNRYINIYDANGNIIEDNEYNDYDHTSRKWIYCYDEATKLQTSFREIITVKNVIIEDNFIECEIVLENRV